MADLVITEKQKLVEIANAIREKVGLDDGMSFPHGFVSSIEKLNNYPEIDGEKFPQLSGLPPIPSSVLDNYKYYVVSKHTNKTDGSFAFLLSACNSAPWYGSDSNGSAQTITGVLSTDLGICYRCINGNDWSIYGDFINEYDNYYCHVLISTGASRPVDVEVVGSSCDIYTKDGAMYFAKKPLAANTSYVVKESDISDIAAAIMNKAKLDEKLNGMIAFPDNFISTINSIQSGFKIASGSFTPSSNVTSYQVTHNLGVPPKVACFICTGSFPSIINGARLGGVAYYNESVNKTNHNAAQFRISGSNIVFNGSATSTGALEDLTSPSSTPSICYMIVAYAATSETIIFGNQNQSNMKFASGKRYEWVVIA